ncbi:MAG TPA: crosslink repair DNA glycosylase YcaQ family protein [Jatrophihabitantaceae bacterium]|nr:crosslink repair DNA glycosylase YcaQ family protein [Jatrophihabitantaceae bacterium]
MYPARRERISAAQATRISLAAQGFADPRPAGRVDARHLRRVIDRIGLLQLDSVNVFCRSHYLPAFSRLGPYPRAALDSIAGHSAGPLRRELFEYWAHEASLVPIELQPCLRWRMAAADEDAWRGMVQLARGNPQLVAEVLALVTAEGPLRAARTGHSRAVHKPGGMWNWHQGKVALEYLFWAGKVSAARRVNFERLYDLTERVLPAAVLGLATPSVADAHRQLIRVAARSLGVATEPDLGDYFRLPRSSSKLRVAELVEAGELMPVQVDGWRAPAYLWPAARWPRQVRTRALLSPFDSLIWFRARAERLFQFRYRIEIYTPAAKRVHGYYVLPFLLDERLVARVDLKSDRRSAVLRVQAAFAEPGTDAGYVAAELAAELESAAGWLGLERVEVAQRGDLAAQLTAAVASRR